MSRRPVNPLREKAIQRIRTDPEFREKIAAKVFNQCVRSDSRGNAPADLPTCLIWTGAKGASGYGHAHVLTGAGVIGVHRLALEVTGRPIPDGYESLHLCDQKLCCEPSHLAVGTRSENARQAHERGLAAHGENHPFAMLSDDAVSLVRGLRDIGLTTKKIADLAGVHAAYAEALVSGRKRPGPEPEDLQALVADWRARLRAGVRREAAP